jgi:hypothetical protein
MQMQGVSVHFKSIISNSTNTTKSATDYGKEKKRAPKSGAKSAENKFRSCHGMGQFLSLEVGYHLPDY